MTAFAKLFSILTAATLSGCLATSQTTHVAEPDTQRVSVRFESDDARRIFIGEVNGRYQRGDGELDRTSWGIPVLYASTESTVLSEGAFFNLQVERADVNQDRLISNSEALGYRDAR